MSQKVFSAESSTSERIAHAIADLWEGLLAWRSWGILAVNDVRQRYRRSVIGQLWLTIGIAVTMIGMGVVFSTILKQPIVTYLPFLGIGLIVWGMISSTINSLAVAYVTNGGYLQAYPGSRAVMLYRTIARELIQFAHNLIIIPVLWALFPIPVSGTMLLFIPAMAICLVNCIWFAILVAPLCARFRDLAQVLNQLVGLMFFFSPIMFRPDDLRNSWPMLIALNPMHYFLDILRSPLLGQAPELLSWIVTIGIAVVGFLVALPFYARFRGRVNYWL